MNKNISTILCLFLSFNVSVFADVNAKAIELMEAMEIRKNIDASMEQVIGFSDQMIESQNLEPEVKAMARAASKKSMQATLDAIRDISWEAMFAEIYADVFTEDEIQGLIDFYQSPVGKKMLEKQPELMAATMQRMQVEMGKFMPQIQAAALSAVAEATEQVEAE